MSFEKALQQYRIAEHLLNTTFPLMKDSKLLMGIIHNISASLEFAVDSLVPKNIALLSKLTLLLEARNISPEQIDLIKKLKSIISLHNKSPVEFKRGNKHVICTEDYGLEILSIHDIEKFLKQTETFLKYTEKQLFQI